MPRCTFATGLLALMLLSCFGTPTPLAPAIGGSVGQPHRGVLTNARSLPGDGTGYVLYRRDGTNWATPRVVAALERAAMAVEQQRPGGSALVVADLAAKHGGKISRHRSHRTGRDADLLFFVLTPDGRSVENPAFLHFGRDGLAFHPPDRMYLRIDIERTWLLVKALVEDEEANVQYLFVADWLEAMLTDYALARGDSNELVWRAATVLRQPSDSSTHDDHIHFRSACTPAEEVAGCRGGGPRRSWHQPVPELTLSDDELLGALLEDDDDGPFSLRDEHDG